MAIEWPGTCKSAISKTLSVSNFVKNNYTGTLEKIFYLYSKISLSKFKAQNLLSQTFRETMVDHCNYAIDRTYNDFIVSLREKL